LSGFGLLYCAGSVAAANLLLYSNSFQPVEPLRAPIQRKYTLSFISIVLFGRRI
jgi:hypothetical protein